MELEKKRVFYLSTPHHMFIKLAWELDYLKKSLKEQNSTFKGHEIASFHSWNVAVTAWHLSDWTWKYLSEEKQRDLSLKLGFEFQNNPAKNLKSFQLALTKKSRALEICWDICNGSKHFDTHKDSKVDAKVEFEIKEARAGEFRVGQRLAETLSFDFLINWEGQVFKAVQIFEEARNFWNDLLAELKLTGEVYVELDIKITRRS